MEIPKLTCWAIFGSFELFVPAKRTAMYEEAVELDTVLLNADSEAKKVRTYREKVQKYMQI